MTGFRFDHVGLLTSDVDYAAACYRALGCEVTERSRRQGAFDAAYLGAGTDVLVQLVDAAVPRPVRGGRGGLALHHVCLLTRDLAGAEEFFGGP